MHHKMLTHLLTQCTLSYFHSVCSFDKTSVSHDRQMYVIRSV